MVVGGVQREKPMRLELKASPLQGHRRVQSNLLRHSHPSQVPKLLHKSMNWGILGNKRISHAKFTQRVCETIYHTGDIALNLHQPSISPLIPQLPPATTTSTTCTATLVQVTIIFPF